MVVVLVVEVGVDALRKLRNLLKYGNRHKPNYRAFADAYDGATWTVPYFDEYWHRIRVDWAQYVHWRQRPFSGTYINIDDRGLRRTWNAPSDDSKGEPRRILVSGGSTVMGAGVRDDETIPSLLAKKLAAAAHHVQVSNFGQLGHNSTQEMISLIELIKKGEIPDLVVFLHGVNEIIPAEQTGRAGTVFNEEGRVGEFNLLMEHRRWDLRRAALAGMMPRTVRRLEEIAEALGIDRRGTVSGILDAESIEPLSREVVRNYLENLRLVRLLAEDRGFQALFFWQPSIFSKKQPTEHEARHLNDGAPRSELRAPLFRAVYKNLLEDPGFRTVTGAHDISGIFDEVAEGRYIDPFHVAAPGNDAIAEAMLPHITAVLGD